MDRGSQAVDGHHHHLISNSLPLNPLQLPTRPAVWFSVFRSLFSGSLVFFLLFFSFLFLPFFFFLFFLLASLSFSSSLCLSLPCPCLSLSLFYRFVINSLISLSLIDLTRPSLFLDSTLHSPSSRLAERWPIDGLIFHSPFHPADRRPACPLPVQSRLVSSCPLSLPFPPSLPLFPLVGCPVTACVSIPGRLSETVHTGFTLHSHTRRFLSSSPSSSSPIETFSLKLLDQTFSSSLVFHGLCRPFVFSFGFFSVFYFFFIFFCAPSRFARLPSRRLRLPFSPPAFQTWQSRSTTAAAANRHGPCRPSRLSRPGLSLSLSLSHSRHCRRRCRRHRRRSRHHYCRRLLPPDRHVP